MTINIINVYRHVNALAFWTNGNFCTCDGWTKTECAMHHHLLFYAIVAISAMAQDTAENAENSQTLQLQIIPECARSCISRWIPDFFTNPDKTCSNWEGSGNPYVTGTSHEMIRQQILNCVVESNCGIQTYTDTAANVGSLCQPSLSAFSTSTSYEPSPTSTITTTLPTDLSPPSGKQKQVESSPTSMPSQSDPQADAAAIPTPTPAASATNNTLSPAVIAGAAVGGLIFLLLIFALIFFWRRKNQRHLQQDDSLESARRPAVWITPPAQNFSRVHSRTVSESSFPISPVSPLKLHNRQESTTAWSPGSPVSPVFSPVQHKRNISVESVTSITSLNDLKEEPEFEEVAISTVSSKTTTRSSIARADSVAWRKEVESAKERAARRVSLMSNPNLSENGGSQSRKNSERSGKLSFGRRSRN
ncbi:hypothetical protein FPQ18DRAFT_322602 [Pyronema domesticum]|nr:hypothetical protein FPQ18DRAFT_322602 [Pyronema domesticum]